MSRSIDYALQVLDDFERFYQSYFLSSSSGRMNAWLGDEFKGATQDLHSCQAFQDALDWSARHLAPTSTSALRAALEDVCAHLQSFARELVGSIDLVPAAVPEPVLEEREYSSLKRIASELAPEYYRAEEYFGLNGPAWHSEDFRQLEAALASPPSSGPRLGDCMMLATTERLFRSEAALDAVYRRIRAVRSDQDLSPLEGAREDLAGCMAAFMQEVLAGPPAWERDSANLIAQFQLAADPTFLPSWLPFRFDRPAAVRQVRNVIRAREAIPDGEGPEFRFSVQSLRSIAVALERCKACLDRPDDPESRIERAVADADLVMVDRPSREVYWRGRPIRPDGWNRSGGLWNLLWTLAAKVGDLVDQSMLMNPDEHRLSSRVHRLNQLLLEDASELLVCIESVPRGCYKLVLPAAKVKLLRDDGTCRLVDVSRRVSTSRRYRRRPSGEAA